MEQTTLEPPIQTQEEILKALHETERRQQEQKILYQQTVTRIPSPRQKPLYWIVPACFLAGIAMVGLYNKAIKPQVKTQNSPPRYAPTTVASYQWRGYHRVAPILP